MKHRQPTTKVLDRGFVTLVDHMGSDLSVVNSARVSFGKRTWEMRPRDAKLVKYLWEHKHSSPFRHATVQLHIKAPIFVLRQWMKHQVGCSWNEASGRYIKFDGDFHQPQFFRLQSKDNKQGSEGCLDETTEQQAQDIYWDACDSALRAYEALLGMGVCKEQARCVLPLSLYTECYWTASLQAVMHFLTLREDSHAQFEIREYAKAVRELITPLFPISLDLGEPNGQ